VIRNQAVFGKKLSIVLCLVGLAACGKNVKEGQGPDVKEISGAQGAQGVNGHDGLSSFFTQGKPAAELGKPGDKAIDATTGKEYQKDDNGNWNLTGRTFVMPKDGAPGKDGVNGKDGKDRINGKDGKDGIDGKEGPAGKDGAPGKDGVNGKDGKDGIDGKDGKDGIDGKEGPAGKDGAPGKDGVNGKDGKDGINGKDGKDGANGKDFTPPVVDKEGDCDTIRREQRSKIIADLKYVDLVKQLNDYYNELNRDNEVSKSDREAIHTALATIEKNGFNDTQERKDATEMIYATNSRVMTRAGLTTVRGVYNDVFANIKNQSTSEQMYIGLGNAVKFNGAVAAVHRKVMDIGNIQALRFVYSPDSEYYQVNLGQLKFQKGKSMNDSKGAPRQDLVTVNDKDGNLYSYIENNLMSLDCKNKTKDFRTDELKAGFSRMKAGEELSIDSFLVK